MATPLIDTTSPQTEQQVTNDDSSVNESVKVEQDGQQDRAGEGDLTVAGEGISGLAGEEGISASAGEKSTQDSGGAGKEGHEDDALKETEEISSSETHPTSEPAVSAEPEDTLPVNDDSTSAANPNNDEPRAPTPVSRTSTPPLQAGSTAPVKKFSSVNVNRQFLKKTNGPTAISPAGTTKINSLTGRPAASPISIGSSSSRLLSSKLVTVPSKNSTSPLPSGSVGASNPVSASPWAKPAITPTSLVETQEPPLMAHPAPSRGKGSAGLAPPAPMGSGVGIGLGSSKPAWRAVSGDGRRLAGNLGISRDFPTAHEVAEGKKQAQIAAQAQAAHNQAIIQGLNAFAQLDPNAHRWDDEDDDDDVIDFGDGSVHPPQEHITEPEPPASAIPDLPVSKSERFAEDFDRSWPPRRPAPSTSAAPISTPSLALPKRPDDKVLFNASSNKLETRNNVMKPPPPPQPTRVMSRPGPPLAGARSFERLPPPHMQDTGSENAEGAGSGRMLPPHMTGRSRPAEVNTAEARSAAPVASASSVRQAWGIQRENDRPLPPHLAERKELPPQSSAFAAAAPPTQTTANIPPRRSFSQTTQPIPAPIATTTSSQAAPPPIPNISNDSQTQEMHTAAEKARLRRLAEEAEREAAAERARRKAKELEERLGLKAETKAEIPPQPPTIPTQPTFTLAQRPKPAPVEAEQPVAAVPSMKAPALAGLPPRPPPEARVESSWRGKLPPTESTQEPEIPARTEYRSARPTAESYFEPSQIEVKMPGTIPLSAQLQVEEEKPVRKETTFEDTMKRIQAALKASKVPPSEIERNTAQMESPPIVKTAHTMSHHHPVSPTAPAVSLRPSHVHIPSSVAEYFDVTQLDPPKSPPPAWRTYTIKLPKSSSNRPLASSSRLPTPAAPPKSFLMTFNPPIDGLSTSSLSRAEVLLAQDPSTRRFARNPNDIWVSISPREFEPYKRQKRKSTSEYPKQIEIDTPPAQLDILLPSPGLAASAQLRSQRAGVSREDRWKADTSPLTGTTPHMPSTAYTQAMAESSRKSRSPIKGSQAAKAEKDGRSFVDGPVGLPERGRMPSMDSKPGVRFMVSSELEGDSLLDEVNKMSLETVEEGYGDPDEEAKGTEMESKTPGSETPKTPPSLSGASSRGHPSSPISNSTPWSKGSARSASQHDHIKSVWDQPESLAPTVPAPQTGASALPSHGSNLDPGIPMYPSLNSPAPIDPTTALASSKHYQSQPFSPTSTTSPYGFAQNPRVSATQPGQYGYTPSSEHTLPQETPSNSMMGLAYGRRPNGTSSSAANGINGYGGVWSSGGFGSSMAATGYGYSPQSQALKEGVSGKSGSYGATSGSAEYRFGPSHSPVSPYGGYQQQPGQAQHPHGHSQPSTTINGFTGYQSRPGQVPSQQAYYGGTNPRLLAQQQQQPGRFGVVSGDYSQQNGYEGSSGAEYYGGIPQGGYGYGGQAQSAALGAIGQQGRAVGPQAQGRKSWQ